MHYYDIDETLYVLQNNNKAMTRPPSWKSKICVGIICWYSSIFHKELDNKLNIGPNILDAIHQVVLQVIYDINVICMTDRCDIVTERTIVSIDFDSLDPVDCIYRTSGINSV